MPQQRPPSPLSPSAHPLPPLHSITPLPTDVMRFNGAAPELVNGRLAMVGLLTAAHTEMATGQTVMQQFASAPVWQYLAFGVIVYASLVPMMKGARHEAFGEWQQLSGQALRALHGAFSTAQQEAQGITAS